MGYGERTDQEVAAFIADQRGAVAASAKVADEMEALLRERQGYESQLVGAEELLAMVPTSEAFAVRVQGLRSSIAAINERLNALGEA